MNEHTEPEQEPADDLGSEPVVVADYDDDEEELSMSIYRSGPRGRGTEGTVYATGNGHPSPNRRPASGAFSAADHMEAAGHALAAAYGVPVQNPHPIAEGLIGSAERFTLSDAAEVALEMSGHALQTGSDPYRIVAAGLNTADFPALLEQTWRGVAESRRSPQLEKILAITAQLEVRDYKAQSFSMVDLAGMGAPTRNTTQNYQYADVIPTGQAVQAWSNFVRIPISVQALQNDDRNLFRAAIAAFMRASHAAELRALVALLEANASLSDGAALFVDGTNDIATGSPPSEATLQTAYATLRSQATEGGDESDADPAVLFVPSDLEVTALQLVRTLPVDQRPRVVASSLLSGDHWYVLADPETFPVLGRVRLENAPLSAVSFGSLEMNEDSPGTYLPCTHTIGLSALSRIGIVRYAAA